MGGTEAIATGERIRIGKLDWRGGGDEDLGEDEWVIIIDIIIFSLTDRRDRDCKQHLHVNRTRTLGTGSRLIGSSGAGGDDYLISPGQSEHSSSFQSLSKTV